MIDGCKNLISVAGSETYNNIGKVVSKTITNNPSNSTMVNLVLVVGSAVITGVMMGITMGVTYVYMDKKHEALRKENQELLDALRKENQERLDAKDARFEAFVASIATRTS